MKRPRERLDRSDKLHSENVVACARRPLLVHPLVANLEQLESIHAEAPYQLIRLPVRPEESNRSLRTRERLVRVVAYAPRQIQPGMERSLRFHITEFHAGVGDNVRIRKEEALPLPVHAPVTSGPLRSEERRVGKEGRSRW